MLALLLCSTLLAPIDTALLNPAPADPLLTVDRLHSGEFRTAGVGRIRWLPDGTHYSIQRGNELYRVEVRTGDEELWISTADLTPPDQDNPIRIEDYHWSPTREQLLIFTDSRRVWRTNSRGNFWVLDLATRRLSRVGADLDSSWLQFAKFSPDGERIAFVYRNDLYVETPSTGKRLRLTFDGTTKISNGTFDWVYEEEWGLRDGFRWSPDGESIAFWQIDASRVREFTLIDNSELYPQLKRFPYPKVGEENPACRIGFVSTCGGEVRWADLPGDPRDHYVARMEWAASPDEILIQRFNRLQNTNRVCLIHRETLALREIFRDTDAAWVEVCDDVRFFDEGRKFTWVSERDGWRHIYGVDRETGELQLWTPGAYDVVEIVSIDEDSQQVYFIASPDNATQRFLYRIPFGGQEPAVRVTPSSLKGTSRYDIAPGAQYAIQTYSGFGVPPSTWIVSLPDNSTVRMLENNAALRAKLATLARGPETFERVEVEPGVEVDAWTIRPPDFDPSRRYPLLVYVYGEPAGQTVRDSWGGGGYLWHRMLAQRGAIVVSFDNRGTPAPRGREWRKSVYRQVGVLAAEDQAAALRSLQTKWPFIDRNRVGIWGWSGGGSMSLNAIFRYPDLYHTAVAVAFVADQRLYDTIYQERYMGLPKDNPDGFRDGSPITHAHRLEGNLLLIYGSGDDNCHYQNCERLVDELIAHDKQFDLMVYPNRSHGIYEGANTRRHLDRLRTQYLKRHLLGSPSGRRMRF